MITVEYYRYVVDHVENDIQTLIVNSALKDTVYFKTLQDHVSNVDQMLSKVFKEAKEWLNNHEGVVIGTVEHKAISYSFRIDSASRLFNQLVQEGHIPRFEGVK